MDLSIIIVSFNTKRLLKGCLTSIFKNGFKGKLEVIVVDNASKDGSALMMTKNFKQVILIKNKENFGFAKAINQGIRKSKGKFVLLLNPDLLLKKSSLDSMVNFAKKEPSLGAIGGRLLDPDGSVQGSCFYLPTLWRAIINSKFFLKYAPQGKKAKEVEVISGAAFLIPRKIIKEVGLLDERYFLYFEDLDYCRRIKKADLKVFYLPQAEFIHFEGASGKTVPQQTHRWLVESSKLYHGQFKYSLITFILWTKQKWQRVLAKG
jgi:GT2 family glycosyltransferase